MKIGKEHGDDRFLVSSSLSFYDSVVSLSARYEIERKKEERRWARWWKQAIFNVVM